MRIFEKGGKTNFVDEADVLVGFDAWQSCCEDFGYYFAASAEKGAEPTPEPKNLEALFFDPVFFEEHDEDNGWGEGGGEAVFRLLDPSDLDAAPVYLWLYNHHNGYYGHGFEMSHNGTVLRSGGL